MKKYSLCILIILLNACSSFGPEHSVSKKSTVAEVKLPAWVTSPMDICREKEEFCGVGEGKSLSSADLQARKSLAQIFEIQIKSKMKTSSIASEDLQNRDSDEWFHQEIQESTNLMLQATKIIKRHSHNGAYFSLASLDRRAMAKETRAQIEDLDHKLQTLLRGKKRLGVFKLESLYREREKLNRRYQFISGRSRGVVSVVNYKQIQESKSHFSANPKKVFLDIGSDYKNREFQTFVTKVFTDRYFRVLSSAARAAYKVKASLVGTKQHMNVKGFEKYKFSLQVISKNQKNEKLGSIEHRYTQMGRSKRQAYNEALPELKKYLEEHIDELNLDEK